jgi:hypothetical protein
MASVEVKAEDAGDWARVQQRLVQNGGIDPSQAAEMIDAAHNHDEGIVHTAVNAAGGSKAGAVHSPRGKASVQVGWCGGNRPCRPRPRWQARPRS